MDARETWKQYSAFYDSSIKDFSADLSFWHHCATLRDHILEVGCGSGRVLKYLLDMGHPVTGVDISPEMIDQAQNKLTPYIKKSLLKLALHDFSHSTLHGTYTIAFVTFYTFNYVIEHPERFISNLANSLYIHGSVVFDLFYPRTRRSPDLDGQWVKDSVKHGGAMVPMKEKRTWNAKKEIEERIQIYGDGGKKTEIVSIRKYYSPDHMRDLLLKAGFTHVEFCTGYSNNWADSLTESSIQANYQIRGTR